jgi:hypothetical protein
MKTYRTSTGSRVDRQLLRPNMGGVDRFVRLSGAITLLYVLFATDVMHGEYLLQVVGAAFAFLNLFAVSTQWCPMYCFTGTDTRSKSARGSL